MAILDQHCAEENAKLAGDSEAVKSEYDFLYVPIDFEYGCCSFPIPRVHFPVSISMLLFISTRVPGFRPI
jgi:hypothetical protein